MRVMRWVGVVALCFATSYFGYYGIRGERGYFVLEEVNQDLTQSHLHLAQLTERRQRLQHRIDLLKAGDPDLVEELARTKLMDGAPGQVAVPRDKN